MPCALPIRSEEHTSELQSHDNLVCRLLLEKKHNKELASHSPNPPLMPHAHQCAPAVRESAVDAGGERVRGRGGEGRMAARTREFFKLRGSTPVQTTYQKGPFLN